MKTFTAKPAETEHKWIVVDAEGAVVGRLASFIALRLRGKHRPDFTPNIDVGDHIVVINAAKVALTGRKEKQKIYYRHTGHPGGIKEVTAGKILGGRYPERVVLKAVERMMPKESPLARRQLGKLRVYAGAEHPHAGQSPVSVDFKGRNTKNSRIG
jgi:large subunit ribosomal protein L13